MPDPVNDAALQLGLHLLHWAGVTDSEDALTDDTTEALDAFLNAVHCSSIPEACRVVGDEL